MIHGTSHTATGFIADSVLFAIGIGAHLAEVNAILATMASCVALVTAIVRLRKLVRSKKEEKADE